MDRESKQKRYRGILTKAEALLEYEKDDIANMANIASLLQEEMGFFWTGFYRAAGSCLVLGPFQGPVACTRLPFGEGVCGSAWKRKECIIVPDVEKFPGHIACSSLSRSEIVVPVWRKGEVIGVLDIDSAQLSCFDETDREALRKICTLLGSPVSACLKHYIEENIIPLYDHFDKGHQRCHVQCVIDQALSLAERYEVEPNIIYTAAAYHDTGLQKDRETHHLESGRIIRSDSHLFQWFDSEQIETIARAAEDHRASSREEPREIYGRIIAEADRQIEPQTIIRRTIQYGLSHCPELDKEGHWERTVEHLNEKYAEGGYLRLWIEESPNAARLNELRCLINDERLLRKLFEDIFSEEALLSAQQRSAFSRTRDRAIA